MSGHQRRRFVGPAPAGSAPSESFGPTCWTTLVARYAENQVRSAELYQQLLFFVARRALAKPRTYLPGFQWESLHGRLPWKVLHDGLALETRAFEASEGANDDEAWDDRIGDSVGIPVDADRFVDAVREVVEKRLIKAIEGPSGFLKLHDRNLSEYQIRAWLRKTVDRILREYWEGNRPNESSFYEAAKRALREHFLLVHDGRKPADGIGRGFYCLRQSWWGLRQDPRAFSNILTEYQVLQQLERVDFVVPRSARTTGAKQERANALAHFFRACFEAVGGPIPEQILIDEAKKFFDITDNDLPISFDGQPHESEGGEKGSFEETLPDGNSERDFHLLSLEPTVREFTEKMSGRERRVAKRMYQRLDNKANRTARQAENHPDAREHEGAIPKSTYYLIRQKVFRAIRSEGIENFDVVLNLIEEKLEVTAGKKTGS